MKVAKYEQKLRNLPLARQIYEKAMDDLGALKAVVVTATVATAVRAAAADVDERNFIPSSAFSIEW